MTQRTCGVDGCTGLHYARTWCRKHYEHWRLHGDPLVATLGQPTRVCSVDGCERPVKFKSHGWCGTHYERWRLHGSTDERPKGNFDRRYALDEGYFDAIDTPDKAYWLGFIAGDGCVRERGILAVSLAAKDCAHLERLKAALRTEAPVRLYTGKSGRREGKRNAALFIHSRHLSDALVLHGITPRKSLTLQAWGGPDDLMRHYWRGLIDADGTIMAVRNQWQVSLVGSRSVVRGFAEWTRSLAPEIAAQPSQVGNIWKFAVRGRVRCRLVAHALYDDCSTALARKAERAATLIAAGPPMRVGHETSLETRLKIGEAARQRHVRRLAGDGDGRLCDDSSSRPRPRSD